MIKKIIALVLCFLMTFSQAAFGASYTDIAKDGSEISVAVGVLSELGIISGMGDGSFAPYAHLTRAQAAKIAVCMMGKMKEAVVTTDAFSDVKSKDWYSGYVNVVAKEGIITGYPDGSFGANDTLTYAQLVTIIVRLLGYDASDVGHKWPQGYIDKAAVLELTEGMSFSANDPIGRAQAAVIIYRALFTDMKGVKTKLVTRMDKNVYEDAIVLATNGENAALLNDEVQTDKGIFTFSSANVDMTEVVGREGTLVVSDKNEVIAFVENEGIEMEEYTVKAVYGDSNSDKVSLVTESGREVEISSKAKVYMAGGEYTAQKLAEGLQAGSTVALFKENDSLKYAFVEEYKNEGPVTVLDADRAKDMFNIENAADVKVVRKGVGATWDDVEMYDVMYYSENTNTVYVYCDRVTGLYEEAFPMKANVSKVTVSGKEYNLSSLTAVNKLNESKGAFEIGDRVTLLFGEDNTVVDAVSLTYEDFSTYAVVTGSSKEISKEGDNIGRTEYFVNLMYGDGSEVRYVVEDDSYFDRAGDLCSVDFENSFAKLTFVKESSVTGFVNGSMKLLGTQKLSDEVKILEYIDGNDTNATVDCIRLIDIDGVKIEKKDVKCVVYNKKGEIEILYLNSVTGNRSVYGVVIDKEVTKDSMGNSTGIYTILSGNDEHRISGVYYPAINKGDCVEYINGVNEKTFIELNLASSGNKIEEILDNVITIGSEKYILADDAVIYMGKTSGELRTVSKEDVEGVTGNIALFSDRTIYTGGKIRVVRIYTAD